MRYANVFSRTRFATTASRPIRRLTFATISFFSKVLYDGRDISRLQYAVYAGVALVSLTTWRLVFRVFLRWAAPSPEKAR